jgi:hypothetical protein
MNQLDIGLTLLCPKCDIFPCICILTDKRSRNYILPLDKTHNEIKPDEDKTMNINNNAIVQLPQEAHNIHKEDGMDEVVDTHGELLNVFFWFLLAEDVDSKPLFLSKPLIVWQYNLSTNQYKHILLINSILHIMIIHI